MSISHVILLVHRTLQSLQHVYICCNKQCCGSELILQYLDSDLDPQIFFSDSGTDLDTDSDSDSYTDSLDVYLDTTIPKFPFIAHEDFMYTVLVRKMFVTVKTSASYH
jgi:hypothetical protein